MQEALDFLEAQHDNPLEFCRAIGFEPDEQQMEIFNNIAIYNRVAVKSGHGTGKTACAAVILLWFLFTHPNSKVVTTAPTWRQVKEILWHEVHKWYNKSLLRTMGAEILDTKLTLGTEMFAIGVSSNKPDNLQGFHAENIMYIIDEANGVDENIFGAVEGALTTNAKILMISNPVNPVGYFYDAFSKHKEFWKTITLSCSKSKFVSPSWIEDRKREWGENSPIYQARVLGEFPEEGVDVLIPLRLVERSMGINVEDFNVPVHNNRSYMQTGVDVARYGTNYSVLVVCEWLHESDLIIVRDVVAHSKKDEFFTAGRAQELDLKHRVNKILIDDTGLGGGVTTSLKHSYLSNKIVPVNFGSASSDVKFGNLKAQIFWNMRVLFETNRILFDKSVEGRHLDRFLSQIPQLRYEFSGNQKISIMDKSDITDDVTDSPDWADALAIALWRMPTTKHIFSRSTA